MSKRNPTIEDVIRLALPIQRKMHKQGAQIRFVIEFEPCEPQPKKQRTSDRASKP